MTTTETIIYAILALIGLVWLFVALMMKMSEEEKDIYKDAWRDRYENRKGKDGK